MIKVYGGLKGLAVFLFFVAGLIFILLVFIWGVTKAAGLLLPILSVISAILIVVFLGCVLPLSFVKKLRPGLIRYCILMSNVLGLTSWMMSFFFVMTTLGFWGILFSCFVQYLALIAFIGAVLKGSWNIAGKLFLWVTFTYGMRFYGRWLGALGSKDHKKTRIIDLEAISSRNIK